MLRVLTLLLTGAVSLSAADRPNILFLFADDMRSDTIAAWGNPNIVTPNLDRLARDGYSFKSNYCMGATGGAVCVPSRAMLNTGKAFFRIKMDMSGERTLGEVLREAGYGAFATGKWHNERPAWLRSFAQGKSVMFGGMSDHSNVPVEDLGADGKLVKGNNGRKFSSELFADNAIEFIENYDDSQQPFYAYIAFTAPHDPRQPPLRYRDFYYRSRPPLPLNFLPQHPFDNGHMDGRDEELADWPRTPTVVSDQLAEYYGMITHLDEQIGRILETLDRSGKADRTYVIFVADHGLAVGSHGLLGKQNVYEHSMKAPLIVRGPDVPRGKSTEAFTYILDLFPTLVNIAGAKAPQGIDGIDIRPLWTGAKQRNRETMFLSFRNLMRSINDGRWKLIRYPQIDHTQLFDLQNDPDEMRSLAEAPEQKARVERMMEMIRESQKQFGDDQELTVANPKSKTIDMTGRKRNVDPWQPMWLIEKYFPGWL